MSALQDIAIDLEAERVGTAALASPLAHSQAHSLSNWFNQLSIGGKITLFFSINLAFALLAGLFVVGGYIELEQRAEGVRQTHERALKAERLMVQITEAQRHAEMFAANGSRARERAAREALNDAESSIAALAQVTRNANPEAYAQVTALRGDVADLDRQLAGPMLRIAPGGNSLVDASAAVAARAAMLAQQLSDGAANKDDGGSTLIRQLLVMWIVLATILTLMTLASQRYFHRTVGATLKAMAGQMSQIAAGERNVAISGKERQDEIGAMARATQVFQQASHRLERLSREQAEHARAELDAQASAQVAQEEARRAREQVLRDIADQFEQTVGEVVTSVVAASSQLQSTATLMANTAEDTSRRTSEAANAMDIANRGATAAAAASDEFAMSIGEISRQAASSAELAREASVSARHADSTIGALSSSALEIGQIVELIQSIARRTNLLALNASIEAARGADQVAVHIGDVRDMALSTGSAASQVLSSATSLEGQADTLSQQVQRFLNKVRAG